LKKVWQRERPTSIEGVNRILNMRAKEHGKSMPSGDTAAATVCNGLYLYVF